ncbi:hypothetical protein DFS33DRAFT_1378021 [Desarmillaria ectypa]|nr:hypothetical protein DFS33DRAFT_1378021 [Desarmillaria ectypa]
MASYPAEFSLQYRDTMLNVTLLESMLYGMYTTVVAFTIWIVVIRDKGRDRLVHGGLVIVMHLIATSHLAVRWSFVRGGFIRHGETEEATYNYFFSAPKWMLVSTAAFMANTFIADCIMIWRCWIICGRRWTFIIIPGLCTIVGTIFAGFSLYQQTAAPPPGSAWSASQIDWTLPYFSMSLVVTLLCTLVIIYRITMIKPSIENGTRRLWTEVIVESAALYAIALIILLAFYATGDVHANYPIVVATMITGLAPTLIVGRVSSGATRPESSWHTSPLSILAFYFSKPDSTEGSVGPASQTLWESQDVKEDLTV